MPALEEHAMNKKTLDIGMSWLALIAVLSLGAGCPVAIDVTVPLDDTDFEASDWTVETHSKNEEPNFEEVFDDTQVKRLDIVVTSERWQTMLDDMTNLYGPFGVISGPGGELIDTDDPVFVPAEVFYNGIEWYRVGIRFKGNSSLQSSWERGILKLSFKLDFDEFEGDYPRSTTSASTDSRSLALRIITMTNPSYERR